MSNINSDNIDKFLKLEILKYYKISPETIQLKKLKKHTDYIILD